MELRIRAAVDAYGWMGERGRGWAAPGLCSDGGFSASPVAVAVPAPMKAPQRVCKQNRLRMLAGARSTGTCDQGMDGSVRLPPAVTTS